MQLLKDSKKVMIFSLEAATFFSILPIEHSPQQAVGNMLPEPAVLRSIVRIKNRF
jgi:hypothetical protein